LTGDCVLHGVCRDPDCRDIRAWRQHTRSANERRDQFVEQTKVAATVRDKMAQAAGMTSPQAFFVTVVSLVPNRLTVLPEERRRAFRERIQLVFDELAYRSDKTSEWTDGLSPSSVADPPPVLSAAAEQLVGAVCAACRGFCCSGGDAHAYLRPETMGRLLRQRPELRIEQLIDLYVDRLPEQSFEGSCVFHGETGCTLPRDMRSDTCNAHFCAGQHSLQAALAQGAPPRAFVAISNGTEVVAGRFLTSPIGPSQPDSDGK
jgi:hypothetical protein